MRYQGIHSAHPSFQRALRALAGTQIITDILQHLAGSVKHSGAVLSMVTGFLAAMGRTLRFVI
jgi:hypothetical protein